MIHDHFLNRVDAAKVINQEGHISAEIAITQLQRFAQGLESDNGCIKLQLKFTLDESGHQVVKGNLTGQVDIECQRCLETVQVDLDIVVNWAIVSTEDAAKSLPKVYDPIILDDRFWDLLEAVEDDLIVSMPIVAYHPSGTCSDLPSQDSINSKAMARTMSRTMDRNLKTSQGIAESASESPFSILKNLKIK